MGQQFYRYDLYLNFSVGISEAHISESLFVEVLNLKARKSFC